ncbi:alpha carbonic anhydrase 7-like [Gossypium australe]|uniref:Alpha carbonic anhydrase 7-like n=1 Tax=Gossypium australe TaxID=47621 RepID=A0A5B6WRI0_9ROSI|nr:alpha carbonic anhydrase 7-like [Gossypium australe]
MKPFDSNKKFREQYVSSMFIEQMKDFFKAKCPYWTMSVNFCDSVVMQRIYSKWIKTCVKKSSGDIKMNFVPWWQPLSRGRSSSPPPFSFKKLKDRPCPTSRMESHSIGYRRELTTSIASFGSFRMEKKGCEFYGRSHAKECRKKIRAYYSCGSRNHIIKDCPSKSEYTIEQ